MKKATRNHINKLLIASILTIISASTWAKCDQSSDCILIIDLTKVHVPSADYGACRRAAIEEINYRAARKVTMKFWDVRAGKCLKETFRR
jgi:hypothetical protein